MIDIQNVSKRYGSVQALGGVTLQARQGQIVGLLGQNGAGKTTLLNIATGFLAPSGGRALINGQDALLNPREAKQSLGYMPERPPLYDEMTVAEYLAFASRLKGVAPKGIPAHVEEVMDKAGLTPMARRLTSHLSKGYRQRVGLAQALCGGPSVLVLDEPTAGLDPKQITETRALIRSLAKGRTILFSSHILSEVQQLCDHVVILHRGQMKLNAPLHAVDQNSPTLLRCTIGAPESALLPALRGLQGVEQVQTQPSCREGETVVLLTFRHQPQPERALFTLLSGLSMPILALSRQEASLEQVFLQAISEA